MMHCSAQGDVRQPGRHLTLHVLRKRVEAPWLCVLGFRRVCPCRVASHPR